MPFLTSGHKRQKSGPTHDAKQWKHTLISALHANLDPSAAALKLKCVTLEPPVAASRTAKIMTVFKKVSWKNCIKYRGLAILLALKLGMSWSSNKIKYKCQEWQTFQEISGHMEIWKRKRKKEREKERKREREREREKERERESKAEKNFFFF